MRVPLLCVLAIVLSVGRLVGRIFETGKGIGSFDVDLLVGSELVTLFCGLAVFAMLLKGHLRGTGVMYEEKVLFFFYQALVMITGQLSLVVDFDIRSLLQMLLFVVGIVLQIVLFMLGFHVYEQKEMTPIETPLVSVYPIDDTESIEL